MARRKRCVVQDDNAMREVTPAREVDSQSLPICQSTPSGSTQSGETRHRVTKRQFDPWQLCVNRPIVVNQSLSGDLLERLTLRCVNHERSSDLAVPASATLCRLQPRRFPIYSGC